MGNFSSSSLRTTINNIKLKQANYTNVNNYSTNTYQEYEEIDYSTPTQTMSSEDINNESTQTIVRDMSATTAPSESMTNSMNSISAKKDNSLSSVCLESLYNYHSTTTTTTVVDLETEKNNDIVNLTQNEKKQFIRIINNNYSQFKNMLLNNIQQMGQLGSYVPQGVCNVEDMTLVSCYDSNKRDCPRVLIIDSSGERRWIDLNLSANTHVGGITYDSINNNIWITGTDGEIGCYSYDSIINNDGKAALAISNIQCNVENVNGNNVASYMTYFEGKIYVGSFNEKDIGCVKEYTIGSNGYSLILTNEFAVPNKVQGISFTKQNGKNYMALSCSYGRTNDSSLKLYEYNNGNINKIDDIKMPPMLEQVTFNEDGTLKCVFESSAETYSGATVEIPAVCSLDIFGCLK